MTKKYFGLVIAAMLIVVVIACSSEANSGVSAPAEDQVASPTEIAQVEPPADDHVAVSDGDTDDDHGDAAEEHAEDDHAVVSDEEHEDEHSEAADHPHGVATVDPEAPVIHVYASEFGYEAESLEVQAGEAFTIMLHNTGLLEHDIVIEGFEDDGGIHLVPGEDGKASFTLPMQGEYKVYCTVPGHRDAGMESVLTVEDDHDHA